MRFVTTTKWYIYASFSCVENCLVPQSESLVTNCYMKLWHSQTRNCSVALFNMSLSKINIHIRIWGYLFTKFKKRMWKIAASDIVKYWRGDSRGHTTWYILWLSHSVGLDSLQIFFKYMIFLKFTSFLKQCRRDWSVIRALGVVYAEAFGNGVPAIIYPSREDTKQKIDYPFISRSAH